ncbi:MAG: alpha/beta hydrolase [Actinomycetia bacterium]|nr:alpha/beta hydrolase [Actinomycetes bacterium]
MAESPGTQFPDAVMVELGGSYDPDGAPEPPITLAVHDTGGGEGRPPVVFCHGFPELGYSWRRQLPAVAGAGFRAIAPDQRGYGASSAPEGAGNYGLGQLCGDLADMLDALEIDKAIFVGHDWGGFVAWAMPALHPDRVEAVVGVCTPYTPFPPTEMLRAMFDDDEKMYMLWFQRPEEPESVMDPRARTMFEKLMVGGVDPAQLLEAGVARDGGMDLNPFRRIDELEPMGDPIATPEEVDHYVEVFERTGFGGGINWYRNLDANAAAFPEAGTMPLGIPTLMITAEWDPALPPALAANMGNVCSDLETHMVERAGHWVQQECPEQVNAILVDWLTRRFG